MGGARRGRAVARCGLAPRQFTSDQPESELQLTRAAGGCIALLLEGPRAPRSACKSASCHRDSSGASVVPSCRRDSRKTTTSTPPAVAIYDPRQRGGAGRRPRGCGAFAVTRSPWGRAGATRLTPPLSMPMRERCLPRTPRTRRPSARARQPCAARSTPALRPRIRCAATPGVTRAGARFPSHFQQTATG
jgi:hypothetical protein